MEGIGAAVMERVADADRRAAGKRRAVLIVAVAHAAATTLISA